MFLTQINLINFDANFRNNTRKELSDYFLALGLSPFSQESTITYLENTFVDNVFKNTQYNEASLIQFLDIISR